MAQKYNRTISSNFLSQFVHLSKTNSSSLTITDLSILGVDVTSLMNNGWLVVLGLTTL